MKNYLLLFLALGIAVSSCKKDNENASDNSNALESTLTAGTWRITNFSFAGENKTAFFNDYTFLFEANSKATAANSLLVVDGSWSIANAEKSALILNYFSPDNPEIFEQLSGDLWQVGSRTDTRIDMKRVIPENNNQTDFLTIERK